MKRFDFNIFSFRRLRSRFFLKSVVNSVLSIKHSTTAINFECSFFSGLFSFHHFFYLKSKYSVKELVSFGGVCGQVMQFVCFVTNRVIRYVESIWLICVVIHSYLFYFFPPKGCCHHTHTQSCYQLCQPTSRCVLPLCHYLMQTMIAALNTGGETCYISPLRTLGMSRSVFSIIYIMEEISSMRPSIVLPYFLYYVYSNVFIFMWCA